jgi:hypothetical protein
MPLQVVLMIQALELTSPTFERIIYPGIGAPFKIVLDNKLVEAVSPPFVYAVKYVDKINYNFSN